MAIPISTPPTIPSAPPTAVAPPKAVQTPAPVASPGVFGFLDGSLYNSQGVQTRPPTTVPVVSAEKASTDLLAKQNSFNQIQQGVATQAANNLVQNQSVPNTPPNDPNKTLTDIKSLLEEEKTPAQKTQQSLEEINAKADEAYNQYKADIDSIRNGTFPLTADEQAQLNYVQQQFDRLKEQQKTANANYEGLTAQLGITSGRQRYAPEIQIGIAKKAVDDGIQKVGDIEAQAANTLSSLRQAFQDKDYKMINDSYDKLTGYLNQKSQTINQIAQSVREEAQLALQKHESDMADAKFEFDKQQAASDFAVKNNVSKKAYLVGNTAINTATGERLSLEDFQKLTGQQVGLPESETDFSELQTDIQTPEEQKMAFDREQLDFQKESEVFDRYVKERQLNIDEGKINSDMNAEVLKNQNDLRKEFNALPTVKDYNSVRQSVDTINSAYQEALNAGGQDSKAAADQVLITAFNKMIDPSSTVREGEFARSTQGQSIINQLRGKADQAIQGGVGLTDQDREAIVKMTDKLYVDYLKNYTNTANQYRGYAGEMSADPDKVAFIADDDAQILLDDYVKTNPDKLSDVGKIEKDNPNLSDLDILQILGAPGFNTVRPDTKTGSTNLTPPSNPTSSNDLKNKNLSYAPDINIPKVNIGAGAAVKNNNPGNLRNTDGSWMKFSTPEEGFKALMGYLERAKTGNHTAYNPNQTLYQFFSKYAPAADSNNPKAYADSVAKQLGVSPTTTINKLDTFAWAKEIAKHESSTKLG